MKQENLVKINCNECGNEEGYYVEKPCGSDLELLSNKETFTFIRCRKCESIDIEVDN
jgi:ribosomal protein L37E